MAKGEIRQMVLGLAGGLAAFGLGLILKMPLVLVLVLAPATYMGVYMATKPQLKIGSVKLAEDNGEEMKQLMQDAFEDLEVLDKGAKSLQDPQIKQLSAGLYRSGVAIFEHLQENPDKIPLARRFINYYLETASGLVSKYDKISRSKVKGDSISKARTHVVQGLEVLTDAFDKQFEHLMQGEIMDITTDVKVLQQTYKTEA